MYYIKREPITFILLFSIVSKVPWISGNLLPSDVIDVEMQNIHLLEDGRHHVIESFITNNLTTILNTMNQKLDALQAVELSHNVNIASLAENVSLLNEQINKFKSTINKTWELTNEKIDASLSAIKGLQEDNFNKLNMKMEQEFTNMKTKINDIECKQNKIFENINDDNSCEQQNQMILNLVNKLLNVSSDHRGYGLPDQKKNFDHLNDNMKNLEFLLINKTTQILSENNILWNNISNLLDHDNELIMNINDQNRIQFKDIVKDEYEHCELIMNQTFKQAFRNQGNLKEIYNLLKKTKDDTIWSFWEIDNNLKKQNSSLSNMINETNSKMEMLISENNQKLLKDIDNVRKLVLEKSLNNGKDTAKTETVLKKSTSYLQHSDDNENQDDKDKNHEDEDDEDRSDEDDENKSDEDDEDKSDEDDNEKKMHMSKQLHKIHSLIRVPKMFIFRHNRVSRKLDQSTDCD